MAIIFGKDDQTETVTDRTIIDDPKLMAEIDRVAKMLFGSLFETVVKEIMPFQKDKTVGLFFDLIFTILGSFNSNTLNALKEQYENTTKEYMDIDRLKEFMFESITRNLVVIAHDSKQRKN